MKARITIVVRAFLQFWLLRNANGCTDTSRENVNVTTGIADVDQSASGVEVYPNPFKDQTALHYIPVQNDVSVRVYNATGQMLFEKHWEDKPAGKHELKLNKQGYLGGSGAFFIQVMIGDHAFMKEVIGVD